VTKDEFLTFLEDAYVSGVVNAKERNRYYQAVDRDDFLEVMGTYMDDEGRLVVEMTYLP
jgi:hypothetical protein